MFLESQTKSLYNFKPCWVKNELGPLLIFEKHTLGFYLLVLYIYIYISPSLIQFSLSAALKEKIYQQIPREINNVICQQEKNLQKCNLPAISCKSSKIFKINQDCIRNLPAIFFKKKSLPAIFEEEIKNPNYQKRTCGLNQARKSSRSFTWVLIGLPSSLDAESFKFLF